MLLGDAKMNLYLDLFIILSWQTVLATRPGCQDSLPFYWLDVTRMLEMNPGVQYNGYLLDFIDILILNPSIFFRCIDHLSLF